MKTKLFIRAGTLSVLLFCMMNPVLSQETDTDTKNPGDTITFPTDSPAIPVIDLRACVSAYTGQTVSGYVFVSGCSPLAVQNVAVINGGDLWLYSPGEININGTFDVLLGGALNIGEGQPPVNSINYIYDASGNRIKRQASP